MAYFRQINVSYSHLEKALKNGLGMGAKDKGKSKMKHV
jgi:hypothetical protein